MGQIGPLVALRQSQGLDVLVSPLESVNDEFNGGRKSPWAIRRFIRYAYNQWNARFVLLMGDGSEDPQNLTGRAGKDWIPIQRILGPVPFSSGSELLLEVIPSDPWYVWCLNCPDPSLAPRLPDLFIGRLPVNSAQQTADIVAKLVAYDNVTPDQTWRREMTLLADDRFSGTTTFGGGGAGSAYCRRDYEIKFLQLTQTVRSVVLDEAGLAESNPEVFDMGVYLAGEPEVGGCRPDAVATQNRTRANVSPQLLSRLNAGRLLWNYQGHANEYVISHESIYANVPGEDDKQYLTNNGKPFLFTAFSCHPNSFARTTEGGPFGPAFGEDLVMLPGGGAIASWASSGYEIIPNSGFDHINIAFARALFAHPPRDDAPGLPGASTALGEVIALALMRWVAHVDTVGYAYERNVGVSYNLLGDPASRISIGSPQALVTANGQAVTDAQAVRLRTSGNALQLDARLVSNASLASIALLRLPGGDPVRADTIPAADYGVSPAFPDTAVTGSGGRRYQLVYDTTLAPDSVTYSLRTVDRYGVPGRFDVVFRFETTLRADGQVVLDGDEVGPNAALELVVLSPSPVDPTTDLVVTNDGDPVGFTAAPANGDASGREWTLTLAHPKFPVDAYVLRAAANGGAATFHRFKVEVGGGELQIKNALAFPNPFEDDLGTYFSFLLSTGNPADVLLRVFTVSGRLIYERKERSLLPGYHQLPWDGRDAEGSKIANGIYVYRLLVTNGTSSAVHTGRLVKLRKPIRRGEAIPGG